MSGYTQVERNILPNGWRNTKYRRADGTIFFVALPKITYTVLDEPVQFGYDEEQEQKTAQRMFELEGSKPHEAPK